MAAISLLNRFTDHLRLVGRSVTHGVEQRQGRFAFVQVIANVFAERLAVRTVVQQIVNQLEGCAQIAAIVLQAFFLRFGTARQNAGALGRRFKQARGFAVDDAHVVFFSDVRVVDVHQLQHFAFSDDVNGFGHHFQHFQGTQAGHHLEGAGIDKIPHQDAGCVPERGVSRGFATTHIRFIHHIVVQKRRRVDKFDERGDSDVGISLIANGSGSQNGNHRTNAFTAAADNVIAQLIDQLNVRVELLQDCCIHTRHILRG